MNALLTIAALEVKTLFKERIFFLLLSVFVCMTVVSTFIGWSTLTTTHAIYNASVIFLHQQGVTQIPLNPVSSFPALSSFRNIIVYMFLIGSLMAIVVGNRSFIRERKSGTLQLLLTRPISRSTLLIGKVFGLCFALLSIITVTAIISIATSYILPLKHLDVQDITRLSVFYIYSFFYIFLFSLLGLLSAIIARSESLALFIPVCFWVGISFVMPELVSGQTPTALLNPVTISTVAAQGSFFSISQQILTPISIGWHYTSLGSQLLNATADTQSLFYILQLNKNNIVLLIILFLSTYLLCSVAIEKFNVVSDMVDD